jgi:hypothetical protein
MTRQQQIIVRDKALNIIRSPWSRRGDLISKHINCLGMNINWIMGTDGAGNKNDCAGEGQKQFIGLHGTYKKKRRRHHSTTGFVYCMIGLCDRIYCNLTSRICVRTAEYAGIIIYYIKEYIHKILNSKKTLRILLLIEHSKKVLTNQLTNNVHGSELFLRSQQFLGYSRISQRHMELTAHYWVRYR